MYPNPENMPSPTAVDFWRYADEKARNTFRAFNEIQSGPNPLSVDEVQAMIDRHPVKFGCLQSWVDAKRGD